MCIKIIELADIHIDPKWLDDQKPCLDLILKTGQENNIDFFCIAGDFYNRAIYNTNQDCINYIRKFVKSMLVIADVVMIYGTPSHDAPGSLGIFQDLGCHILQPNKPEIIKNTLFIGLPEIDKTNLMSRKNMTQQQANIYIEESINKFVKEWWIPVREKHKDKSCVFLGHGVFVDDPDKEKNNPIIKNSDFVIDNRLLAEIKADHYILGHIHNRDCFLSSILNGGYVGFMGFDKNPWNSTGFQPHFRLTEIDHDNGVISEIDYPVTRKEKLNIDYSGNNIFNELSKFANCDVKIKLNIKSNENINIEKIQNINIEKFSLHSLKIVPVFQKKESSRITHEEEKKIKSLWDRYILFNKNNTDFSKGNYQKKIEEIEKNVNNTYYKSSKKKIVLLSIKITGSIFSKTAQDKNTFFLDFSKLPPGLNLITGDNGSGKSAFLGFLSLHPIFIGFDYRSLKQFFIDENSRIEKCFSIDNEKHFHIIDIGNKIKCYWNKKVNGYFEKVAETESLSDFTNLCNDYFGPVENFIYTSFFSQNLHNINKYISSIVDCSKTELRNVYLNITGISREKEKEYAISKINDLKQEINNLEIKKNTINTFVSSNKDIENEKNKIEQEISTLQVKFNQHNDNISCIEKENKKLLDDYNTSIANDREKEILKEKLSNYEKDKKSLISKVRGKDLNDLEQKIINNDRNNTFLNSLREKYLILQSHKNKLEREVNNLNSENNILVSNIKNLENKKSNIKPCAKCGFIPIEKEKIIENCNSEISRLLLESNKLVKNIKNKNENIDNLINIELSDVKLQALAIKQRIIDKEEIKIIKQDIDNIKKYQDIEKNISEIKTRLSEITVDPFVIDSFSSNKEILTILIKKREDILCKLNKNKGLYESIIQQLTKIKQNENELNDIMCQLDKKIIDLLEWEQIQKDMNSNKLPAFELDIIAKEIDYKINQKLNERFRIETITQDINKKGDIIDRFDIIIHDLVANRQKSISEFSRGERITFFSEPVAQVLREVRQERQGVVFNFSISDETDDPVKHSNIHAYYQSMRESIQDDHIRLIVSQKSETYNYVDNIINIEDICINEEIGEKIDKY